MPTQIVSRLDVDISATMADGRIPGATIGVWSPQGTYLKSFGIADRRTGQPMDSALLMRIGSETKTFTVTALLRLVDHGRLKLDDPIGNYLPGVPGGDRVTIRHLAGMRSGLPSYLSNPSFAKAFLADPSRQYTSQELLDYAFAQPTLFAPGTTFNYSNTNTILLGKLVEQFSGQSLAAQMQANVFGPLKLAATSYPQDGRARGLDSPPCYHRRRRIHLTSKYLLGGRMSAARRRVLQAAMRLFGERGYAATTVAQIEAAAGLSPGSGGLYAHFASKEALLRAGLEAILEPDPHLFPAEPDSQPSSGTRPRQDAAAPTLDDQLDAMARAGLARLDHDRDLNRILVRDLRALPDLLQLTADREIRPIHDRLAGFLTEAMGPATTRHVDARALAAVLVGATSHYWLLTDIFGEHPAGVSEDDYVATLVRCASALITQVET